MYFIFNSPWEDTHEKFMGHIAEMYPTVLIRGEFNKFPDFFCTGI